MSKINTGEGVALELGVARYIVKITKVFWISKEFLETTKFKKICKLLEISNALLITKE